MHEFSNGDEVIVTGELKGEGGTHYSRGDFWASDIVVVLLAPVGSVPVSVDASYDGKEVDVLVGRSLRVTLESNPTTGFQWELTESSDQTVLKQTDHEFKAPETALVGAGGHEVWTFEALKKGESTISMEYSRPWESVEPAETFVLTIVVK